MMEKPSDQFEKKEFRVCFYNENGWAFNFSFIFFFANSYDSVSHHFLLEHADKIEQTLPYRDLCESTWQKQSFIRIYLHAELKNFFQIVWWIMYMYILSKVAWQSIFENYWKKPLFAETSNWGILIFDPFLLNVH